MDDTSSSLLRQLFESALEVPAEDLQAFLDNACAGDAATIAEVLALLEAHKDPVHFFDPKVTPVEVPGVDAASNLTRMQWMLVDDKPGDVIDRYRLVEVIGEGGHGVVYRAEQEQPIRRQVALKVIRRGMETDAGRARFESERQTLAQMDHPDIARLYDAGTTEAGRPYFVMELVSGIAVTQFCDQHRYSIRARVELFTAICRAVHHAHQRGVIHGDLKPSNILVKDSDGVVSPKVIDFGISRPNSELSPQEASQQVFGTPQYMSPEQAIRNSAIDIRSDVYALGAMLYELLTGMMAIESADRQFKSIEEFRAAVEAWIPVPPSERVLKTVASVPGAARLSEVAQFRSVPVSSLPGLLREDLDWIVMRSIQRQRANRYDSVAALADDLQRYLERRPVLAAPSSYSYVGRRFIGRNKLAVAFSLAIAASLLTSLYVISISLIHARASLARAVSDEKVITRDEAEKIQRLGDTYLEEAKADERSHWEGQRFHSLRAISLAAQIAPSSALRNEAIACLSLPDVEPLAQWNLLTPQTSMMFSNRMDRYAIWNAEGNVEIRNAVDRTLIGVLNSDGYPSDGFMHFSPDDRFLYVGYQSQLCNCRIWDLKTRMPVFSYRSPSPDFWVSGIGFSHDSRWFAVPAPGHVVEIHSLYSGQDVRSFPTKGWVGFISFRPGDQQLLVTGPAVGVQLISLQSGQITQLRPNATSVSSIAWRPDGRQVAIASGEPINKIELVDADTGSLQAYMTGHMLPVNSMCYTHDSRFLISQGWDCRMRLWDIAYGAELLSFNSLGCTQQISNDDSHLSFNGKSGRELWRLVESEQCKSVIGIVQDISMVSSDFSPDGTLFAAATHGGVRLWNLKTGEEAGYFSRGGSRTVLFDRDGTHLLLSTPTDVLRLSTSDLRGREDPVPETVNGLAGSTCAMAATPDWKRVVFGSNDGTIRAGDPDQLSDSFAVGRDSGPPRYASISPDGAWAATSLRFEPVFKIWDLNKRCLAIDIPLMKGDIETGEIGFSPDGKFLITSEDKAFCWYSVGDWKLVRRLDRQLSAQPGLVAFSPDGKLLALSGPGYSTMLVDPASGQEFATLDTQLPHVAGAMIFSRDSTHLAISGAGPSILIWDITALHRSLAEMNLDWSEQKTR